MSDELQYAINTLFKKAGDILGLESKDKILVDSGKNGISLVVECNENDWKNFRGALKTIKGQNTNLFNNDPYFSEINPNKVTAHFKYTKDNNKGGEVIIPIEAAEFIGKVVQDCMVPEVSKVK